MPRLQLRPPHGDHRLEETDGLGTVRKVVEFVRRPKYVLEGVTNAVRLDQASMAHPSARPHLQRRHPVAPASAVDVHPHSRDGGHLCLDSTKDGVRNARLVLRANQTGGKHTDRDVTSHNLWSRRNAQSKRKRIHVAQQKTYKKRDRHLFGTVIYGSSRLCLVPSNAHLGLHAVHAAVGTRTSQHVYRLFPELDHSQTAEVRTGLPVQSSAKEP